jgi:hypothetical protein
MPGSISATDADARGEVRIWDVGEWS